MKFTRCLNESCRRPFQVNQFNASLSQLSDPGEIVCPHCGLLTRGEGTSVFLTHALSEDEEAHFNRQNVLPKA